MSHAVSSVLKKADGINAIIANKNISRVITEAHVETILNNTIKSSGKVCIIKDVLELRSLIFVENR